MSRPHTGVMNINESLKLDIKTVIKIGLSDENTSTKNYKGRTVTILVKFDKSKTDNQVIIFCAGQTQVINIVGIPSNIGKGLVWYLLCPATVKRSKQLYMAYGATTFRHRTAYRNRLYYKSQQACKGDYNNGRYFDLKENSDFNVLCDKYNSKNRKTHYRGKRTKWYDKLMKLDKQITKFDKKRMIDFNRVQRKGFITQVSKMLAYDL